MEKVQGCQYFLKALQVRAFVYVWSEMLSCLLSKYQTKVDIVPSALCATRDFRESDWSRHPQSLQQHSYVKDREVVRKLTKQKTHFALFLTLCVNIFYLTKSEGVWRFPT